MRAQVFLTDEMLSAGFGCCSGGDASPTGCSCAQGTQGGGDGGRGASSVSSGGSGAHHGRDHGLLHHQDDGDSPERHVLRRACSWQYAAEPFDDDCNRSVASGASGSGSADSSTADEHKLGYSSSLVDHTAEPSEACPQRYGELFCFLGGVMPYACYPVRTTVSDGGVIFDCVAAAKSRTTRTTTGTTTVTAM